MPQFPTQHPTADELRSFGLGQLDDQRHAAVEEHVASCGSCCEALGNLTDDKLMERVRQADTDAEAETRHLPKGEPSPKPSPHSPPQDEIPKELADHPRYNVLHTLGRGGMGVVYKAEHRMMQRPVALKVINRSMAMDAAVVERFHREVQAAAKLDHRNIVTAHDAEQAGDLHFLVMEFVEGKDLADVVTKRGPLPILNACNYIRQAAAGLQHAHDHGMVHRDIKPQNLMLTPRGRIKILDFGLARFAGENRADAEMSADGGLTNEGVALGTPDYIAPEQVRDARSADIRADIYSLGCTFHFLLTDQPPFPKRSTMEKLLAHVNEAPPPVAELCEDVPAEVVAIVNRMMAKYPVVRFQTPGEIAEALTPFATKQVSADSLAGQSPKPPPIPASAAAIPTDDFFDPSTERQNEIVQTAELPMPTVSIPSASNLPASRKTRSLPVRTVVAAATVLLAAMVAFFWWPHDFFDHLGTTSGTNDEMSLFDGRTLNGWQANENPSSWSVDEGAIVASGSRSVLFYDAGDASFREFEFRAEVKTDSGANSGIFFCTQYVTSGFPDKLGYEVQINNSFANDQRKTGSLWGVVDVDASPVEDDQWFTIAIRVTGQRIVVHINDVQTVDYVDPNEKQRLQPGSFALQCFPDSSPVRFRNLRVRRIGSGGANGRGQSQEDHERLGSSAAMTNRVLAVLPHDTYWWPDYDSIRGPLVQAGYEIVIASSQPGVATPEDADPSRRQQRALPVGVVLSAARAADYDAVIFSGAAAPDRNMEFINDPQQLEAAKRFIDAMLAAGKPVTAICNGNAVLAEGGYLAGKSAAGSPMPNVMARHPDVQWSPIGQVIRTSPLILSGGGETGQEFARTLVEMLGQR